MKKQIVLILFISMTMPIVPVFAMEKKTQSQKVENHLKEKADKCACCNRKKDLEICATCFHKQFGASHLICFVCGAGIVTLTQLLAEYGKQ